MAIRYIHIQNYKSLRDVGLYPTPLLALVGPNAAGKSNFCDALDFLGEVYRLGLEVAVARKGGYENISYRRERRSKAPIKFRVVFEVGPKEWHPYILDIRIPQTDVVVFEHEFEFRAESQNIDAPFHIATESLKINTEQQRKGRNGDASVATYKESRTIFSYERKGTELKIDLEKLRSAASSKRAFEVIDLYLDRQSIEKRTQRFLKTELALPTIDSVMFGILSPFKEVIGALRVFQLSPRHCREAGIPTPNSELGRFGENLPAVIDYLKTHHPKKYQELISTIQRIIPTLKGIETQYTHRKTLGLTISETGFGRPWAAEDISDGTIQSIALLAALFDPRIRVICIEEPENSVHPWAIRQFVESARNATAEKQVILTTHSQVLIDQLRPEEIWLARRPETETLIDPIVKLDPTLEDGWRDGQFTLSNYLDSGVLPEAVPTN